MILLYINSLVTHYTISLSWTELSTAQSQLVLLLFLLLMLTLQFSKKDDNSVNIKKLHNRVVCGSVHTGSLFAHMFVGPCKETYLSSFNQIHISIPTSFERRKKEKNIYMCSWEILKPTFLFNERVITINILRFSILSTFIIKET